MDGLKQRIIGALVLVSLAVIFVPMLFDEPHSERTSTSIKIPEEPPFPEVTSPEADTSMPPSYEEPASAAESETPAQVESAADAPDYRIVEDSQDPFDSPPESSQPEPVDPVEETADEVAENTTPADEPSKASGNESETESAEYTRSLEGAWVVQLGSFGNADNARRLRDKVRDKGYGSHLQKVERGDATLTRVFSGPFASKADAEAAKRSLDEAFSLNSLVTTGDK
ncbi:SPOR domain-containing protein [Marinobacter sp. M216]|uniref:SPOR domain-containing protein n=1 Tax=Marinobacter albus TaxID=3030833 RepID=A0ABT7HBK9_9GAMM|nr:MULTISPECIES: SPOR domain-containing protein [unclassified Marinobacter]MBW7469976.1 SPOR domain-containing protein [Marinobacter sp. F4218]MDK9557761.1 SPOR domain-containing protein [Marinobacter sp. M216]